MTQHQSSPTVTSARLPAIERVVALLLLLAALLLPFMVEGYRTYQFANALVYAIALLGLGLLIGLSGQISLGHGAFMALGAYGAAFLVLGLGLPYAVAVPLAGLVCFALGLAIGIPALRFAGHYLALCTFALAVAIPQLLKAKALETLTHGVGGLTLPKPTWPSNILTSDQWIYLVHLAIFIAMFLFVRNLSEGKIGRALIALRDHPTAAACMGVDVARLKTMAFGVAAGCGGLAGALGAAMVQYVAPDSFSIMLSVSLLVGAVVGGIGRPMGAIFGALFIQFVPDLAESFSKSAPWAIYAFFVILTAVALPMGLAGMVRTGLERLTRGGR